MPIRLFTFLILLIPSILFAQIEVKGRVVDDRTLEPLAFVHILAEGAREGTTTDINGQFSIQVADPSIALQFSYVGYAPLRIEADPVTPMLVRMQRTAVELKAVEILPGENPAHRIIDRVYANRKINDGMRNRSHRYRSYSKTIFTAEMDSAVLNDPQRMAALDSNDREAIDWLDRQHLLLIESATAKSFIPPAAEKEEVLAMRVSGLKDPSLLALAASTKTFSIYEPQITINQKTYLSPIGPGSTDRYLFILQDTLYHGVDSVFIISFQPRRGKKFEGLKGALYVNTDGYALQNVLAEPVERSGGISLRLQQEFRKVNGSVWFPFQLNTFLYLDNVQINDWKLMGIGRTYLKEIEVDVPIERKEVRGPELSIEREAMRRDDQLWNGLRETPLDQRELNTYHVMDSIGEEAKFDRRLKWFAVLMSGKFPIGPFDLRLRDLVNYNEYEGLRPGLSLATNDRISRYFSIGGHGAYGFRDEALKYGADLSVTPRPGRDLEIRGSYENDVAESGGSDLPIKGRYITEWYRMWSVDRMDRMERIQAQLRFRVNSSLKMWIGSERADRWNLIGYQYVDRLSENISFKRDRYSAGSIFAGFRFAFRERLVRLPDRQISTGTTWPVLDVQASKAFAGLWQGELDLWRIEARVEKTFRLRMLGDLSIHLRGGAAQENSPCSFLFNMRGTFDRDFGVMVPNTFPVMRPNEFLADRYVAVHMQHSFRNLIFKWKKFRPIPVLVGNAAWGKLSLPELHEGLAFNTLGEGYYEAGLQLDNLINGAFSGFGIGAYMRLGEHMFEKGLDNFAFKLTATMR